MCGHVCKGELCRFPVHLLDLRFAFEQWLIECVMTKCFLCVEFKEYFKLHPEGFRAEDVYVCESRYSAKSKSFKKIKMWAMPLSSVRFLPREIPLPVVRVASMFAPKQEEKPPEIADESKMTDGIVDKVNASFFVYPLKNYSGPVIKQSTVRNIICVSRRERMCQWIWPMGSRGVSTTSSSATTICGWKWETVFTLVHMD